MRGILQLGFGALYFAASGHAAPAVNTQCHADYCLRALRATQFPTRLPQASVDCSAFWTTTVSPTTTITYSVTNTRTIPITTSETLTKSDTVTQTDISTTVILSTSTTQDPLLYAPPALARRAQTIPSYASWCSGAARYTSACSCIGASPVTVTNPTAALTVTVSTTSTYSATASTAIATNTLTTTKTVTRTESGTATVVSVVATLTVRTFTFACQNQYGDRFGVFNGDPNQNSAEVVFTSDQRSQATKFFLTSGGVLSTIKDNVVYTFQAPSPLYYSNISGFEGVRTDYAPLVCEINDDFTLTCRTDGTLRAFGFSGNPNSAFIMAPTTFVINNLDLGPCQPRAIVP